MSWQPLLGQYQRGLISYNFSASSSHSISSASSHGRLVPHLCFCGVCWIKKITPPLTWSTLIKAVARGHRCSKDFHAAPSSLPTFTMNALQQIKRSFATGDKQVCISSLHQNWCSFHLSSHRCPVGLQFHSVPCLSQMNDELLHTGKR